MNMFGDYISRLRNYSKMTQEQLADKMEVSKTTIQNWESGRTKVKPAHLKRLAYLFNVPETSLIFELNRDNDSMRVDNFPYFLIEDDEELVGIIESLHLNLNQQELFGLICLFYPDVLIDYVDYDSVWDESLTKIPFDFICKVGSIQYMNLADGLRNLLKYVRPKFLLKVLKLYPEELFDVTRLSKDLIIEFLDTGHIPYYYEYDDAFGFDFNINLEKASVVLPILEKGCIHIADTDQIGSTLSSDVPQEIIDASLYPHNENCLVFHVLSGLSSVTTVREDKKGLYLEINDLGCRLLRWFQEKE